MQKLLCVITLLFPICLYAQYSTYIDSSYYQNFQYLSSSTLVNQGQFWDQPNYKIPIGFTFHLFSDSTDTLYLTPWTGNDAILNIHPVYANTSHVSYIFAHNSDLKDKDTFLVNSKSPISFKTEGIAPWRICKLEFRNAGFELGSYADSMNLQIWLFETSNNIEVKFGQSNYVTSSSNLYNGSQGPWIGLVDSLDRNSPVKLARKYYFLKGSSTSPTLDSTTSLTDTNPLGMTGHPPPDIVYRFSPKIATKSPETYSSFLPNLSTKIKYSMPTKEIQVTIYATDKFHYLLYDVNGRIILRGYLHKGNHAIQTNFLPEGLYMLQLSAAKENFTYKFMK